MTLDTTGSEATNLETTQEPVGVIDTTIDTEVVDTEQDTDIESEDSQEVEDGSESDNDSEKPTEQPDEDLNKQAKEIRLAREKLELERQEIEAYKKDMAISKKYSEEYGISSEADIKEVFGEYGVETLEDLETYLEAIEEGIDPVAYKEKQELLEKNKALESRLAELENKERREQQTKELENDRVFKAHREEIVGLADVLGKDISIARLLFIDAHPELFEIDENAIIKKYIDGLKQGNQPIEGSGSGVVEVNNEDTSLGTAKQRMIERLNQYGS